MRKNPIKHVLDMFSAPTAPVEDAPKPKRNRKTRAKAKR
jgi:hypothetical protein